MKGLFIVLSVVLFSCQKDIFQKDKKQLIGKWELNRAWKNPDGAAIDKRDKTREAWEIEFTNENNVIFNDGNRKLYGKYEQSYSQLKMALYNDSSNLEDVWLWYELNITKKSIQAYTMEDKNEYNYIWRKLD